MMDPTVEIQSGLVRGVIEKDEDGFDYYAFKGIPYTEPPTGELRFQDPVTIKKWSGVWDARNYGSICAQYDLISKNVSDEEDCLHLNLYTKVIHQPNVKKAVMVWIHGGIFYFGGANDYFYGPQYWIRKDIVLVTVNYRLGIFGFLNLEDEIAPGNQGFKDQVMALRWIQQNIQVFGGDPDNVTVFGHSAGGASVHYLTLSPLAQGLFHKAISQSGIACSSWSIVSNSKRNAMKLCGLLGKDLKDAKSIHDFLKTVDAQKLRESQERFRVTLGFIPFGPGIDVKSRTPFMPISPHIAAERGVHIPYLVGYTRREGIFFLLGACHTDELKYLFKMRAFDDMKQQQLQKGTHSYKMMERMSEMWTNFAKHGRPTVTTSELIPIHWLPVADGTLLRYMNIDEDLTMQFTLNVEQKYSSTTDLKM